MNNIKVVGNLLDESNKFKASGRVYDGGDITPTLGSCHFQSEKYLIETKELKVEDSLEVEVLGGMGEKKSNNGTQYYQQHRVYNPDMISPAMNSSGEELAPKVVIVKQATKEGCIPCKVGGGGGFELSRLTDQKRASNRERRDKPNSNDGEYP